MKAKAFPRFLNFLRQSPEDKFSFAAALIFYLLLWFFDPENKIIAVSFLGLAGLFYLRFRDFRLSILLSYITSLIVNTGKTYVLQLIPPGIFPLDQWPEGYLVRLVVAPKHVLAGLLSLVVLRDFHLWKRIRLSLNDIFFGGYFILALTAAIFASPRPEISLVVTLLALHSLIFYLYLRLYLPRWPNFLLILVGLLAAIITFETLISGLQFLAGSPVGKKLEAQVGIEFFGAAVDEPEFRFRPVGTFGHANELASFLTLLLSLPLFIYLFMQKANYFFLFLLGTANLILTLSRSAWGALTISLAAIFWQFKKTYSLRGSKVSRRNLILIGVLSLPLVIFFIVPRIEKSLYTFSADGGGGYIRGLQLKNALSLIALHPFLGVGAEMSVPEGLALDPRGIMASFPTPVHNIYLLSAVEQGIPATIFLFGFMVRYLYQLLLGLRGGIKNALEAGIGLGVLAGSLTILIIGMFQPYLHLEFLLLGLVTATHALTLKHEKK